MHILIILIIAIVALFFGINCAIAIFAMVLEAIRKFFKRLGEILEGMGKIVAILSVSIFVLYVAYSLWPWLWSCLGWIFNVVGGGLGWIFNVVSGVVSWIFNGVFGGVSWTSNVVSGGVSWTSNSLNFGAIYGSLGAGSEYYTWIFIAAIVAFILCLNNDKQNKWAWRCWCYIPVILLAAAPIVGYYANVPIFAMTPVGVRTLGADVVASQVILLIWLLTTALVLVAGMYIEKQRNELQVKIKAVDSALEKLRT